MSEFGHSQLHDGIDRRDPRTLLEERESASDDMVETQEAAFALGRILAWMLDARSLVHVGIRVHVAAHKIRTDLTAGRSLQKIGQMAGLRRSAIHKISKEFETQFDIHGPHDKSPETREKLARSWRRAHPDCPARA